MLTTAIVFIFLFAALMGGVPVIICLGLVGSAWILVSGNNPMAIISAYYEGINSFVQLAVPFFVLAGDLMSRSRITEKLIGFAKLFVGRVRGGLAYTTVLTSMFFAGLTGAGVSDVSALGPIFIPALEKEKYSRVWVTTLVACSAIIGPTIPPSIIAVLYGAVTRTSIGGMLLACCIPGVMLGIAFMIVVFLMRNRHNLPDDRQYIQAKEIPAVLKDSVLALMMPLIILGGILTGVFTATEAAAVAAFYALIVGTLVLKALTRRDLTESLSATVKVSANMYLLMSSGAILTWMMARTGVPTQIASTLLGISPDPLFIFTVSLVIILFLGMFMDNAVAMILVAPIMTPIARQVGIPDLQFGASMVVALNIGLITPPFGMCLFAAATVGKVKYEKMLPYVWPFFFASMIVLVLTVIFPELTLWLPRMGGFVQ